MDAISRKVSGIDEWAADQDPHFRKHFYEDMIPAPAANGKTVIAETHDDHYFHEADRIFKMDYGKVDSIQDTRAEGIQETIEFLDTNGMVVAAGVSVHFHPAQDTLCLLHQSIGPEYREKVMPELVSALRDVLRTQTYQEFNTQPESK